MAGVVDWQVLFNICFTLAGGLFGLFLKIIYDQYKSLMAADQALAEKVARVEILVAGQYISRAEFERVVDRLFTKLDDLARHE